jgi:menaquinone-dependent protoporphyrinogen oxidase
MVKSLVVFGSKYGSTAEVAAAVADGLGADVANAAGHPDIRPYDVVVIGSPIYGGNYMETVIDFIRSNKPLLARRRVAAFITAATSWELPAGLTGDMDEGFYTQQDYADGLARMAGGQTLGSRGFGGRLDPEHLDEADFGALDWIFRYLMKRPLQGFDLIDIPEAYRWGQELRELTGG